MSKILIPNSKHAIWLKMWGRTADPLPRNYNFLEQTEALFSNQRAPVMVGDILICYAVKIRRICAVVRSRSPLRMSKCEGPNDRYPWYATIEILTPRFAANWYEHNLTPFDLSRQFKSKNPNLPLTASCENSFGVLRGATAVKLAPDFGRFLVEEVERVEAKQDEPSLSP